MTPRRWVATLAAMALGLLVLSGCTGTLATDIQMDRHGRGDVTLTLNLDQGALQFLGLSASDPTGVANRFLPLLQEGGWEPADGGESVQQNVLSLSGDGAGGLVLRTRKKFDNVAGLTAIMSDKRNLTGIPSTPDVLSSIPGMPTEAPLINEFTFRLGTGTGDNPGFNFFGRGGVGEIGRPTCAAERIDGFGKTLRDALQLQYRLKVPGGPGSTTATQISNGTGIWLTRFGDCPDLRAESGGGSSSTLVNGLVLGVLAGLLMIVFLGRGIRRRRGTRRPQGPPPPVDDPT